MDFQGDQCKKMENSTGVTVQYFSGKAPSRNQNFVGLFYIFVVYFTFSKIASSK